MPTKDLTLLVTFTLPDYCRQLHLQCKTFIYNCFNCFIILKDCKNQDLISTLNGNMKHYTNKEDMMAALLTVVSLLFMTNILVLDNPVSNLTQICLFDFTSQQQYQLFGDYVFKPSHFIQIHTVPTGLQTALFLCGAPSRELSVQF